MEVELESERQQRAHEVGGAAPTRVARWWPPWKPSDTNSNSIYLLSERKKSERRNHHVLQYGAAAKP